MNRALELHDKTLVNHGVGSQGHPVAEALCALMAARVDEIKERLLLESDPARIYGLQGAAVELRRWAAYPEELAARAQLVGSEQVAGS